MAYKVIWCVDFYDAHRRYKTGIHGRIYAEDRNDAMEKLKKIVEEDLIKLRKQFPNLKWYKDVRGDGVCASIESSRITDYYGDYDDRYYVLYGTCKRRIPV